MRLLGAAACHGLLTGQIVFSAAFVVACELPNWLHAPRQVSACLERWIEVGAFYWTALAPDIVNPGRVEQGSTSV